MVKMEFILVILLSFFKKWQTSFYITKYSSLLKLEACVKNYDKKS